MSMRAGLMRGTDRKRVFSVGLLRTYVAGRRPVRTASRVFLGRKVERAVRRERVVVVVEGRHDARQHSRQSGASCEACTLKLNFDHKFSQIQSDVSTSFR